MKAPLIDRLVDELGYPLLDAKSIDSFVEEHEHTVLFFTENPKFFPESNDVAVILPELVGLFGDRLRLAVVSREAERDLRLRYQFSGWPTLVFLRRGAYLGAISRVQDWEVYLEEIDRILDSEPSRPPKLTLPGLPSGRQ